MTTDDKPLEPTTAAKPKAKSKKPAKAKDAIDPLALPYVMMSELRYLPTCAGVYFAIEAGDQVAYVGQSVNIRNRWRRHHREGDLCDLSDLEAARGVKIAWLEVSDLAKLSEIEREMIQRFRPRLNKARSVASRPRGWLKLSWPRLGRIAYDPPDAIEAWLFYGLTALTIALLFIGFVVYAYRERALRYELMEIKQKQATEQRQNEEAAK